MQRQLYTLFLSLLLLLAAQPTLAIIRYVRPVASGNGSGSSWANASSDLQAMINASGTNDEVWVAAGTYLPRYDALGNATPSNNRERTFRLRTNVRVYGGFAGNETTIAGRSGGASILSGDLGTAGVATDNAFHVVLGYNLTAAVLDGFTITGGNANGSGALDLDGQVILRNWGGGFYGVFAGITVNRCVFTANNASQQGGGFYIRESTNPVITNCTFQSNTAPQGAGALNSEMANSTFGECSFISNNGTTGAGLYNIISTPTIRNVLFAQNAATGNGGGFYNESGNPNILQSVFWSNSAVNGGGAYSSGGGLQLTNCTVARNSATTNSGGIFVTGATGAKLMTCIVWGNTAPTNAAINNGFSTISYSTVQSASVPAGTGNKNTDPVFININDGDGNDNLWRTADDGVGISGCSPAIDAGENGTLSLTTDFTGATRRVDVPFVANTGNGTAPIVDMGAYENQANITAAQFRGQIGNAHTIPRKRELFPDSVTSVVDPIAFPGLTISWQKADSINGTWSAWSAATPQQSTPFYILTDSVFPNTVRYRRVSTVCGTSYFTDSVRIKVVVPNGAIAGKVVSRNETAVKGITISVKKTMDIMGSPASHVYTTTTGDDGTFLIQNIYYGDPDLLVGASTEFEIRPSKPNHGFNPSVLRRGLSQNLPTNPNPANFRDTTVFSVTGSTIQTCTDCNNASTGATEIQNCPIDSVEMFRDNQFFMRTTFLNPPGGFGLWANSVSDPGTYRYEPRFRNHQFDPPFINLPVSGNVANVNFTDTTTRVISGRLTAGCNEFIGTALLDFYDLLPPDGQGNPRPSCFRKRVTTQPVTGYYEIRLPARRYQVRVVSFSQSSNVTNLDLLDFFNNRTSKDSLTRDITTDNAVLNMVYERPPVISISGLDNSCAPNAYVVIPQAVERTFTMQVRQGNTTCPAIGDSIILNTNVQQEDVNERLAFKLTNGNAEVKLKGGIPNIIAPHFKTFNAIFSDRFGRANATLNRNVVVTGVKANTATFTTVSPEIPLMILHDPPGDNSFSFWETSRTNETTLTMFAANNRSINAWAEVKIGTEFQAGLGISTTTSIWGSIKGSVNVGSQTRNANETVLSTTTTQNFSTSNNPSVVGSQGDVFIGAALNLIYSIANELTYLPPCSLSLQKKLIIANKGFQTQYIYTEEHIRGNIIPTLKMFLDNPGTTPEKKREYANQISIWEQVLNNNEQNKKRAAFDKNLSFDGAAGPITSTTTTTASRRSTVEFAMNIDATVAAEIGLEIAGSGASGGVEVAFKMETGGSVSNNVLNSTTIGYTLDDDDNGDFFSVDIKKDPVYNTPVFELVAGTSSCPTEEGSQPRDEMQLVIPEPVKNNVDPNGEAEFILRLGNTSQSQETRTYQLSFLQASNPNGAQITVGGSPYITPINYTIGYLGEVQVLVKVRRGASQVFSYEGLQFMLSDACGGDQSKIGSISANFQSQCSAVELAMPENNWVVTTAENNLLPVVIKGYNLAGLTKVELEYSLQGTSNWIRAFERTAAQLNNSVNGTQVNWNITDIPDGRYNLRLKLTCGFGVVYSQRSTGIIDRTAPIVFGKTNPTDDVYTTGDAIGINYNETLDCSTVNNSKVSLRRLSNGQLLNINIGCTDNQIVIVPQDNIGSFTGDSMLVEIKNLRDQYGNLRTSTDVWRFNIGQFTPATTGRALNLSINNSNINENSGQFIEYVFTLAQTAPQDIRINYMVSGNAVAGTDYTVQYVDSQKLNTVHTSSEGSITLFKNTTQTRLRIRPVGNSFFEPNKTIRLILAEGGDYQLGTNITASGTIVNDDTPTVYTFTGNGNFTNNGNWVNGAKPPAVLEIGSEIIIDPGGNGECILDTPLTIKPGAKLTVAPGKVLRLVNGLQIKWN